MSEFRYLHDFTFPELAEATIPVIDSTGIMWAGPNRKGMNAPNQNDLWKRWQKDTQANIYDCHQRVREYFQATLHFSKPPKKQDAEAVAAQMIKQYPDKLKDAAEKVVAAVTPKFTWSPTKLQQFATCPYQFAATHYYKTLPYQETEASIWGNRVHKAAEDYLLGKGVSDPEAFKPVEKYVKFFEKVPGQRMVEEKISVDTSFKPCEYDEGEGRMIADLAILNDDHLIVADWKGLALDTPLPTPEGWTTMSDVKVGDELIGSNGRPCKVLGKSKVKNIKCYEIAFCDGEKIVCDEEHLWEISSKVGFDSKIVSAKNLASIERKFRKVRLAAPIWPDFDMLSGLPMYTIGCWLGDGKHTDGSITKQDGTMFDSISFEMGVLPAQKTTHDSCACRTVKGLRTILGKEGLLGNKHIPDRYLRFGYTDRLALLQGLFDSDGYWNPTRRQAILTTVREDIAKSVHELLCTLGQRPKIHHVKKKGFGKEFMGWDVAFSPINIVPFRCTRRIAQFSNKGAPYKKLKPRNYRYINSVVEVPSVPTQCIKVSSQDSMYLCGKSFVPTHNTGRVKDDHFQLRTYALLLAIKYPQVQKITYKYIWVKDDVVTGGELLRTELVPVAKDLKRRIEEVRSAWVNENFPAKLNGLCRRWCQVSDCTHCGGR